MFFLLALAALAAPEAVPATVAPVLPAPDLHATFGWAPGDAWSVDFERSTTSRGSGPPRKDTRVTSRWTATVGGAPGALEIRASDYTLDVLTGLPEDDLSGGYTHAILAMGPSFRLGPDGAVAELLDLAAARAASEKVLAGNLLLTAEAAAAVREMMSDAQLVAMTEDWWSMLVAAWIDAELDQGEPVSIRLSQAMPMLGNLPVELLVGFTYEGPTACTYGAPVTCEVLVSRSTLDPKGVADAVSATANGVIRAQGGPDMRVAALAQDTTARLVTEADDLRPRSLVVERLLRMSGTMGAESFDVEQTDTRTWTFTPLPASTAGTGAPKP